MISGCLATASLLSRCLLWGNASSALRLTLVRECKIRKIGLGNASIIVELSNIGNMGLTTTSIAVELSTIRSVPSIAIFEAVNIN